MFAANCQILAFYQNGRFKFVCFIVYKYFCYCVAEVKTNFYFCYLLFNGNRFFHFILCNFNYNFI